ncbi:MAG: twin-arginine translocation pathway signal protein [Aliishimia sp.]
MNLSRRRTLAILGGGTIFAAAGSFGYSVTRPLQSALKPWEIAGTYDDPRMRALSWAILAPNPHNRQPWKVDLSQPDTVVLYADTDRLLPHTDPFSRQITIGLGCLLELMQMAALEEGWEVKTDLFPEGSDVAALDQRPVAICRFAPTPAAHDPLFEHVLQRRSLKEPFDTARPVAQSDLTQVIETACVTQAGGSIASDDITYFRGLSSKALMVELETPHTYKESVDLIRIGRREVDANPDGIDFTGPLFESLGRLGMFTRDGLIDPDGAMFQQGVNAVLENTQTAMGHIWLVTPANQRQDQIAVGRDWLRTNLAVTALGLGMQPLSQALQEYTEMSAIYAEIHDRLAPNGGTVQMFSRIGYGPQVPPSPRWTLDAKRIDGIT